MLPIHYGDACSIIPASQLAELRDKFHDDYTVGYFSFSTGEGETHMPDNRLYFTLPKTGYSPGQIEDFKYSQLLQNVWAEIYATELSVSSELDGIYLVNPEANVWQRPIVNYETTDEPAPQSTHPATIRVVNIWQGMNENAVAAALQTLITLPGVGVRVMAIPAASASFHNMFAMQPPPGFTAVAVQEDLLYEFTSSMPLNEIAIQDVRHYEREMENRNYWMTTLQYVQRLLVSTRAHSVQFVIQPSSVPPGYWTQHAHVHSPGTRNPSARSGGPGIGNGLRWVNQQY